LRAFIFHTKNYLPFILKIKNKNKIISCYIKSKRVSLENNIHLHMLTKEFNALSLSERSKLVFGQGKLIDIYQDHVMQKGFYYKLNDLKIDVIYDKVRNRLLDIIAWENLVDRVAFPQVSA